MHLKAIQWLHSHSLRVSSNSAELHNYKYLMKTLNHFDTNIELHDQIDVVCGGVRLELMLGLKKK